jgi:hypothetical protein
MNYAQHRCQCCFVRVCRIAANAIRLGGEGENVRRAIIKNDPWYEVAYVNNH